MGEKGGKGTGSGGGRGVGQRRGAEALRLSRRARAAAEATTLAEAPGNVRLRETERDPARGREVRAPGGEGTRRAGNVREKSRRAHARGRTRPPAGARRSPSPALPRARVPGCPRAMAPATPRVRRWMAGDRGCHAPAWPSLLVGAVWRSFPLHSVSRSPGWHCGVCTEKEPRHRETKQFVLGHIATELQNYDLNPDL